MQITKNNATCSICGKPYYMCVSCKDQQMLSPWKIHTDTAEHYKVYQILHGISVGIYTKQEAKDRLQNVDLRDKDSLLPRIKQRIDEIMSTNNVIANKKNDVKVQNDEEKVEEVKNEKTFVKSFGKKK